MLTRGVLRRGAQESKIVFEDVLDPEKHVAETGGAHGARQRLAGRRNRGRHPLHDVVDVVQTGAGDRLAQRLETRRVESDVVVDEENRPAAATAGSGELGED